MDHSREDININIAHRKRRRADKLVKACRFSEAITAHQEAIVVLEKLFALAADPVVRESLELQVVFHRRQQKVILYKQERQKSLFNWRQASISHSRTTTDTVELAEMALPDGDRSSYLAGDISLDEILQQHEHQQKDGLITQQLCAIIDRNDELLARLYGKPSENPLATSGGSLASCTSDNIKSSFIGEATSTSSDPTEEIQVLDELRSNNLEIRRLVNSLADDKEKLLQRNRQLQKEVEVLRNKVQHLERNQPPCHGEDEAPVIPELAPLEIPSFENFTIASPSGYFR